MGLVEREREIERNNERERERKKEREGRTTKRKTEKATMIEAQEQPRKWRSCHRYRANGIFRDAWGNGGAAPRRHESGCLAFSKCRPV